MDKLSRRSHFRDELAGQGHFENISCQCFLLYDLHLFLSDHGCTPIAGIASVEKVMDSNTRRTASAVSREVKHGIPFSTDSRRIRKPSRSGCLPFVNVLIMSWASPFWMTSNSVC